MGEYFLNTLSLAHHLANMMQRYQLTGLIYNPISNDFVATYSVPNGSSYIKLNHDSVNHRQITHIEELEKNFSPDID